MVRLNYILTDISYLTWYCRAGNWSQPPTRLNLNILLNTKSYKSLKSHSFCAKVTAIICFRLFTSIVLIIMVKIKIFVSNLTHFMHETMFWLRIHFTLQQLEKKFNLSPMDWLRNLRCVPNADIYQSIILWEVVKNLRSISMKCCCGVVKLELKRNFKLSSNFSKFSKFKNCKINLFEKLLKKYPKSKLVFILGSLQNNVFVNFLV